MTRRFVRSGFACALATSIVLVSASLAGATGYWNVPSTMCQWCGCGFGGGYHAPLILGPVTYECLHPPNDVRISYAPNPYACAPCYNGSGYHGNDFSGEEPTMMAPDAQPVSMAQPEGVPAARRLPIFASPVQR